MDVGALFLYGERRILNAGIEDYYLRGTIARVLAVVPRIHHLNDGISGFEKECPVVFGYDGQFAAK